MIEDSLVIEALERVLTGEAVHPIAREKNIAPERLLHELNKFPEYKEYRQKLKQEKEQQKEQVLELGRQGYACVVIAKKLNISENTVYSWLKKAGIDTSTMGSDDMVCPSCNGALKKQPLFFWRCECGCEFWPPEESIPEDVEDWTRPWRVRHEEGDETLRIMKRLYDEGKNAAEIARELNERGLKTPSGKEWKPGNTMNHLKAYGIKEGNYQKSRDRVLEICKQMAGKQGITCKDIADRLNMEGLKTSRNQPWSMHSVRRVIRETLKLDVNLYRTDSIMLKREHSGKGKGGRDHPWSKQATAEYEAWLKRQEQEGDGK